MQIEILCIVMMIILFGIGFALGYAAKLEKILKEKNDHDRK